MMIQKPFATNEKSYRSHLLCSKEIKMMIMKQCVDEFLRHHPEMVGIKISQGFMLRRLALYYLGESA